MAKNGKIAKWVGIGITLLVLSGGMLLAFANTQSKAVQTEKAVLGSFKAIQNVKIETKLEIHELKEGGCDPAQLHKTQIAVMENQLNTMQKQNEKGFEEMLRRLPQ